ncbi:hypothetical protein N2152v2_004796 [Parachlorella kessleri]
MADQVVDPAYVLRAARSFLSVVHPVGVEGGDAEQAEEDGWEACGCLLWDIAAIPEQAELLAANNIQEILQTILAVSISQERWRALEIALGLLANLACHRDVRQALLSSPTLARLVLERALWVDDTPALAEACRLLAGLPHLVASLLQLDILPAVATILSAYLSQLQKEQQEFDGGEGARAGSSPPWEEALEETSQPAERAGKGSPSAVSGPAVAVPEEAGGSSEAGKGAAGATAGEAAAGAHGQEPGGGEQEDGPGPEVNEATALEALSLVDGLTATEAGIAAASEAGPIVGTVLQLLALSDSIQVHMVCATLLASLDAIGSQLASCPGALRGALGLLRAVQGVPVGATRGPEVPGAAEAQAAWALFSVALHAAVQQQAEAVVSGASHVPKPGAEPVSGNKTQGMAGAVTGDRNAPKSSGSSMDIGGLLDAAADFSDVLVGDWAGEVGGQAVLAQQQYCLQQLQHLLGREQEGGRPFSRQQATLQGQLTALEPSLLPAIAAGNGSPPSVVDAAL